jgi:hypothetical protein
VCDAHAVDVPNDEEQPGASSSVPERQPADLLGERGPWTGEFTASEPPQHNTAGVASRGSGIPTVACSAWDRIAVSRRRKHSTTGSSFAGKCGQNVALMSDAAVTRRVRADALEVAGAGGLSGHGFHADRLVCLLWLDTWRAVEFPLGKTERSVYYGAALTFLRRFVRPSRPNRTGLQPRGTGLMNAFTTHRRHRHPLQGLGQRTARHLQPRLAAERRRLGQPAARCRGERLSRHRP